MGNMSNKSLNRAVFIGMLQQCRRFTNHLSWYRNSTAKERAYDQEKYDRFNKAKAETMETLERLRRSNGFSQEDGA